MKLFGTPLTTTLFFALWVGVGSLAGLAVGALIGMGGGAFAYAPLWLLLAAGLVGGVYFLARREHDAAPPAPSAAAPPAKRAPVANASTTPARAPRSLGTMRVAIDLPQVPAGYPPVVGKDEDVLVRLRVMLRGEPAAGAAVRLSGTLRDGGRALVKEGVTGSDGSVQFTLRPPGTGELVLEAAVSLDDDHGQGSATVGVVQYEEEIERLFGEFRAYATSVLGQEAEVDTARELSEKLRRSADARTSRALMELARIYELVAYGERPADRRLYLSLVGQLLVLEGSDPSVDDASGADAGASARATVEG